MRKEEENNKLMVERERKVEEKLAIEERLKKLVEEKEVTANRLHSVYSELENARIMAAESAEKKESVQTLKETETKAYESLVKLR